MAELTELGKNACAAKYILQKLTTEEKNKALDTAANYLCDRQAEILAANESDLENGRRNGMNPGLLDRLKLTPDRIAQIAEGLRPDFRASRLYRRGYGTFRASQRIKDR